jgi:Rieske Fe-S protein
LSLTTTKSIATATSTTLSLTTTTSTATPTLTAVTLATPALTATTPSVATTAVSATSTWTSLHLLQDYPKERQQVEKEVQKHRNNWLARRRKAMRNETNEQRDLRVERESKLNADLETARNRPFINGSQSPVYNPNSPRVETGRFSPHSPDYPPPTPRSPASL